MKVYGLRRIQTNHHYRPVYGFFSSLTEAKKMGRQTFEKQDGWEIASYVIPDRLTQQDMLDLLNADLLRGILTGKTLWEMINCEEVCWTHTPRGKSE